MKAQEVGVVDMGVYFKWKTPNQLVLDGLGLYIYTVYIVLGVKHGGLPV